VYRSFSSRRFQFVLCAAVCFGLVACTDQQNPSDGELTRQVLDSGQDLALSFDGVADYASTATAQFPFARGNQTLSAWFELDVVAGKHAILTLRKDFDSGVEFGLQDGLLTAWRVFGNRTLVAATAPVTAGVWHHGAYTFDGTTNQIYVDGALAASSTNVPDERTPTSSWLGTLDGTSDLFQGKVDDWRIFSRVRTKAELAAEAAGTFTPNDPALVLDLPCNEGAGAVLFDHSELANDGELGDGVAQNMPSRVASGAKNDEP
jgi:hypothetical protein